jgi:hypothetical protein
VCLRSPLMSNVSRQKSRMRPSHRAFLLLVSLVPAPCVALAPMYVSSRDVITVLAWAAGALLLLLSPFVRGKGLPVIGIVLLAGPTVTDYVEGLGKDRETALTKEDVAAFQSKFSQFCASAQSGTASTRATSSTSDVALQLQCDAQTYPNFCISLEGALLRAFHGSPANCKASLVSTIIGKDPFSGQTIQYTACEPGIAGGAGAARYSVQAIPKRSELHRGRANFSYVVFYEAELRVVNVESRAVLGSTVFFRTESAAHQTDPQWRKRCPNFEDLVSELAPVIFPR